MSDNIKVVVKVRPLISREIEDKSSYQWRVKNNTLLQIDQNGRDIGQAFTFDKVYDKETKTSDVYKDIAKPIVEAATAGINGTIFAYGQTSSGKTYTMAGTEESPGIIPLAVLNLFEIIKNVPDRDFLVRVSYIEIYNETLKDLLNVEKDNIKIHESLQGIKVDVTEKVTSSPEEVLEAMKEGEANRQTGATNMNEKSSRSHSIFQITIESREHIEGEEEVGCVNVSQLNLVDLAGSERSGQTGATGIRFKEGTHINKSLSSLALVIKQLSEDPNKYANYRDSKLTRILQNSLGGNAKTSIICAVTPAAIEETISTLQFANRAKAIKNKPEVNAVATDATMIQSLTKQLSKLQAQLETKKKLEVILESKKHVEQDNYNLQKQIAALQKLILNGFGQRRGVDPGGSRRKQPLRRITISTLHAIEEHPAPPHPVPRFCTPALKYNPMAMASASDFVPIQNPSNLASLPEEPLRLVTPPPNEKRVNFSDEIIELDSDDDDNLSVKTCSPYHKCYGSSKTPPCILRKNAKLAEKNLKDIVELTEREKIYTPSVVEFIEKLEHNATVIAKLQDEVNSLHTQSKEKDFEMEQFKNKIKKTEEQLQSLTSAKMALETQCKNYNIKLTDWEVSYDTLKKKSKLREEELLSLLDEQKVRKPGDSGELMRKTIEKELSNFMNMSKDVSLVSSDNETNITQQDEPSTQILNVVSDLNTQLTLKNQIILELEANICAQKQRIEVLENSNQELNDMMNCFKYKLTKVEDENSLLKTTIDTLNSTIKSQKTNLEIATNDMESYNSVIQELQIQLTHKESILNTNISDSVLESMIANEEKFIANNENMKNIIHSFKIALVTRNKEINQLKTTQQNSDPNTDTLLKDLQAKEKQIESLNKDIHKLDEHAKENITIINKLVREKNNVTAVELDLTQKLTEAETKLIILENKSKENITQIQTLKKINENLTSEISNKNIKEQEILNNNQDLIKEITRLESTISELEKDNNSKNDLISALDKEDKISRENLIKAKSAMVKLQDIIALLGGKVQKYPEIIENFVNIFKVFTENLNSLETTVVDIVSQKQGAINNMELKEELSQLITNQNIEISDLQSQIEILRKSENNLTLENNELTQELNKLTNELTNTRNEIESKVKNNATLETMLTEFKQKNEALQIDLLSQAQIISSLQNIETTLSYEKQELLMESKQVEHDLKQDVEKLNSSINSRQERFDQILQEQEKNMTGLENTLKEKCDEIAILTETMKDVCMKRDQLMESILKKITHLTDSFNITNNSSFQLRQQDSTMMYDVILLTLDKIANHMNLLNSENIHREQNYCEAIFLEAKEQIRELTQQNVELLSKVAQVEDKNQELCDEIERIQSDNNSLDGNLSDGHELLKKVQLELKIKCEEFANMEAKVREWRDQFNNLDISMKQQMQELQEENDNLKFRLFEMKEKTTDQINHLDVLELDNYEINNVKKYTSEDIVETKHSPKSLVTICCSNILDHIQPKEKSSSNVSPCSSNSNIEVKNAETQTHECKCNQLSSELLITQQENSDLISIVEQLKLVNQHLIEEREEVRKEIQLLIGPTYELQKKLENHRTNLSILTATTYAENKSLISQVKGLQHHHTRFHNVCQRDIPAFKKQLCELMTILNAGALTDTQNVCFKRYSLPDVLDNNTLKNDSTLDGDLLMMDTNVTLTTTGDNTLVGCDQTCLDLTQTLYNEASCQTIELNQTTESNMVYSQMELLSTDNRSMFKKLDVLKEENRKLREQIDKFTNFRGSAVDAQNSPIKMQRDVKYNSCEKCRNIEELQSTLLELQKESKNISQELTETKTQKAHIEQKYENLKLEIPSSDALVRKLSVLEKDYSIKTNEVVLLNSALSKKSQQIKSLQEENDTLSTQVMENISEADDLNKELDKLKQSNFQLSEKCSNLEKLVKEPRDVKLANAKGCYQCVLKDKIIQSIRGTHISESHSKLNRSYSDSDKSSRYNKICTLQSELHAGREDCKELSEEVTTIKQHLERSNISMDLDESIGDSNVFTCTKNVPRSPQSNTCSMPDIQEERPQDVYMVDKIDCLNYYIEKAGPENESLTCDMKIIDVMRMFYNNLIVKHNNEVDNLVNKLRDHEESKNQLQTQLNSVTADFTKMTKELKEKDYNIKIASDVLSKIKHNINTINNEMTNVEVDKNPKLADIFKQNILQILDTGFGLSSMNAFDIFINKITNQHQKDLCGIMDRYSMLQKDIERVTGELASVNNTLSKMKCQLSEKESEYNLLKAQKERIHEISNAVTLDIIKKEKELNETITKGCQNLLNLNIINPGDIDLALPLNKNIALLIEHLINQHNIGSRPELEKENDNLKLEIKNSKMAFDEKDKQLLEIKTQNEKIQEINNCLNHDLLDKENKLCSSKTLHDDLNKLYNSKVEENKANLILIERLTEEIKILKENIIRNEASVQKNSEKNEEVKDFTEKVKVLQDENERLKSINEMINKEKQAYADQLEKLGATIRHNNEELNKMTSDILILRESAKEHSTVIEALKSEAKSLVKQNSALAEQFEDKCRACATLTTNIKTHEKTAEIQSRMINRLQKLKDEDDKLIIEKDIQIEELSVKYTTVQKECEHLQNCIKTANDELNELKTVKESLEARVSEMEAALENLPKRRSSIDAILDSSRRRRQSFHDSKRMFSDDRHDLEESCNLSAVFESGHKSEDVCMDFDENQSNRSSPIRLSKGRDSLLSRTDQSERESEAGSRPGSVRAARRRRQTCHDLHRSVTPATPEPHEELNNLKQIESDVTGSEVPQLKERLASYQQELEELKEKYRDLDEECEICAQYLRESDEQCRKLKKEKAALEHLVTELRTQLESPIEKNESKPNIAHASVNTDEDWTNLHAVVVDRMSYDAEVEKNKKLTKTIEDLRFKKQDLKNTMAKMQKALEKYSGKDNRELEATKQELQRCKDELRDLRQKYNELDEECETCADYLRERDEQCKKLKEAKAALEAKLHEYQEDTGVLARAHSLRARRRSALDRHRATPTAHTSDDFLSSQVERDDSSQRTMDETPTKKINSLIATVDRLKEQKAALEKQLLCTAQPAMHVATGSAIVQNQQLTDVMKENQKLKKINAKLVNICKKRGKSGANRENEDPSEQG